MYATTQQGAEDGGNVSWEVVQRTVLALKQNKLVKPYCNRYHVL